MNISGIVVHARQESREEVAERLASMPGVEVHAVDPSGKIVVTAEDTDSDTEVNLITDFHHIPGVLSASMVFHHFEDEVENRTDSMQEDLAERILNEAPDLGRLS
jgi:nitrate reductase NapD